MKPQPLLFISLALVLFSCAKNDIKNNNPKEDAATFREIGSIDVGDAGAAEITAYDPQTQRLFVVNNGITNKIDVLDLTNPAAPVFLFSISTSQFGGFVNSLAVHDGVLAAAVESGNKQAPGVVALFKTCDNTLIRTVAVGTLPDMVTYSPDGKYILTANEGEPSADYLNDPEGTVSIISVKDDYAVTNIGFGAFAGQQAALVEKGLRIFGPNASLAQDVEPEYITVSDDSRTAWVTLQENNAIAKIDILARKATGIFPLYFKSYNNSAAAADVSDKDGVVLFAPKPVLGMYQPDAIAVYQTGGVPYLFTANEGDAREYAAFTEGKRVKDLALDASVFRDAAALQTEAQLGRLNVTTTLGSGKTGYTALYSFGARSFSVWNGNTGAQLFDSGNELDAKAQTAGRYDDNRSDDKGAEPEGLAIGTVGKEPIAFVGLERADAVAVYAIANPLAPHFLKLLPCGDAPEGVLFIPAKDSPTKQSLLVVSSENDGVIKIYSPER